jgi:hypothetical protein
MFSDIATKTMETDYRMMHKTISGMVEGYNTQLQNTLGGKGGIS